MVGAPTLALLAAVCLAPPQPAVPAAATIVAAGERAPARLCDNPICSNVAVPSHGASRSADHGDWLVIRLRPWRIWFVTNPVAEQRAAPSDRLDDDRLERPPRD